MEFAHFDHRERLSQRQELFEDAFPENKGTALASVEHYLWKFHHAPAAPPSYEYEATEDGKMLGYYAAIPYPYQLGDRNVRGGMVCDVMTSSQARGKGVFTELGRYALAEMQAANVSFVTGYPIRPEVMGGHLRAGWQVAFQLPMYLRPLKANAILKSKHLSLLTPVANLAIAAYQALRAARPQEGYEPSVGAPRELLRSRSFEAFVEEWSKSVRNHLVKSPDFYDWRLSAPGTEYRAFLVYRDEAVVAAAVARRSLLHGIPSFALLDLMVLKGEERALPTLYRHVDNEAKRHGAEAIVTMMSTLRAREYRLTRFGFLRSPFTFKLIVRALSDAVAVEEISAERDWHLMWIDSDDL
ncbi:MAG: hypothetical protein JWM85_393 [Acidimicrobiaceae bacterium]|nr:hypothetical protein [Acidimicrobiaceae bacterium]